MVINHNRAIRASKDTIFKVHKYSIRSLRHFRRTVHIMVFIEIKKLIKFFKL